MHFFQGKMIPALMVIGSTIILLAIDFFASLHHIHLAAVQPLAANTWMQDRQSAMKCDEFGCLRLATMIPLICWYFQNCLYVSWDCEELHKKMWIPILEIYMYILYINIYNISGQIIIEGSLEVKLPTIWTDEKQSRAEGERRERLEERRSEKRKSQKKEDADARKGRKVAKHCVFPMICGSGGSKSRLAKAAGAEPAGQMRDEKLHAVVARSTFPSQNVQNTPGSDHFWKLRCRKSACRCGAKHISKSKV